MSKNLVSTQWVLIATRENMLTVKHVGTSMVVISSLPNVHELKAGDGLRPCKGGYIIQRRKGRPTVGGVILPPLSVPIHMAQAISAKAVRDSKPSSEIRRHIISQWMKGGEK
jgi:hypothetical protein